MYISLESGGCLGLQWGTVAPVGGPGGKAPQPKLNFKHLEGDLTLSTDTNFRYFFCLKIVKIDFELK
jgi:hypothetical protein